MKPLIGAGALAAVLAAAPVASGAPVNFAGVVCGGDDPDWALTIGDGRATFSGHGHGVLPLRVIAEFAQGDAAGLEAIEDTGAAGETAHLRLIALPGSCRPGPAAAVWFEDAQGLAVFTGCCRMPGDR